RQSCDELLSQIGVRCSRLASNPKLVARLVGDQFAVLLTDVKSADNVARMLELRNREIFGASYRVGDTELAVTAKFGIAVFPGDAENPESLLKKLRRRSIGPRRPETGICSTRSK